MYPNGFAPSTRPLARLERQVVRLNRLVEELLDVARISSDRLRRQPERLELIELVTEVTERFSAHAAQVLFPKGSGALGGEWDPVRLEQVLTQLLGNAVRHGKGGAIEVEVEAAGDKAILRVRDHGVGIPSSEHQRIFERFSQVAPQDGTGFGVGLWIVRSLVLAMGGEISVESAPGRGATFTVTLPIVTPNPAERPDKLLHEA